MYANTKVASLEAAFLRSEVQMTDEELVDAVRKGSGYMTVVSAAFCRAVGIRPRTTAPRPCERIRHGGLTRSEAVWLMRNERPVNMNDVW